MATKLSGSGRISQYRDPNPKFYGIKHSHGSQVVAGSIILTQIGNKYYPGKNVVQGKNFTLNTTIDGIVHFEKKSKFGKKKLRTYVSILPLNESM